MEHPRQSSSTHNFHTRDSSWATSTHRQSGGYATQSRARLVGDSDAALDDSWSDAAFNPRERKPLTRGQSIRQRQARDQIKNRRLGVTWKNLTVKGVGANHAFNENVRSQFNIPRKIIEGRRGVPLKTIIDQSSGSVQPGEMLLVLGRPGAGTTTLLKILANRRSGYAQVTGDVHFGSMDAKEALRYRGQIVMNTEEEVFFPSLTVGETIDFATRLKIPGKTPTNYQTGKQYQKQVKDFLLLSMGIEHTVDTKVGNEYVRGVSGGERKRTSILEVLATRASVFCWDNSTRGLDASTALDFARAIRALTDVLGIASIMTLYQAGNGIYELFNKVLVLDEGKQIYYGPLKDARPFMEHVGFQYTPGANIADFLTGVTVPTERQIRRGYEAIFPRNAAALRIEYDHSPIRIHMDTECAFPSTAAAKQMTAEFREGVAYEQSGHLPKKSPLTVSFFQQVVATIIRQYQLLWGDKASFFIKHGSTITQALITGSLFYNAPDNSSGLFLKGGALFFSLLYNTLMAMSEVTDSFTARPVLAKHRALAFHHPAAFCLAQIATDIPILIFQVSIFTVPLYWMTGLKPTADAFLTFWIVVFAVAMCMAAFFRAIGAMFGSFDAASKVSGFAVTVVLMYVGYMIPRPAMHVWFSWIYWINPLSYGYNALLSNEFHNETIPCANNNLIPNGPGYTNATYQACSGVRGAPSGSNNLTGVEYLDALDYSYNTLWRNFGCIWAFWLLFVILTVVFTCNWKQTAENSGFLVIPREKAKKAQHIIMDNESLGSESPVTEKSSSTSEDPKKDDIVQGELIQNTSVFTWRNLTYTVKTASGDRKLLDDVQGWVQPGQLGALMGSSGAGKTTLLDVLAQRKTEGTIRGSILVDGRQLPVSFQRSAGYCEQLDVHEPLATVREALEFSALLRQSKDTPKGKKLQYVDTIIDLLEMRDIENTIIGTTAAGLSVEQRKRLTIGVELVAKPSILIFLDEPTSGLDGQAAYNIVRFLRKLANVGQAILVTIHQPSASLFAQFDTLLLLASGGKTVYFGDIGKDAQTIKEYFGRHGAPCPPDANPAEHMIDVVSGTLGQGRDWNEVWLRSREYTRVVKTLDSMIAEAASNPPGTLDDGREFATSMWEQTKLVTHRMNVSLWRNTDYANNKFMLHLVTALFNGFTFWMIGNSVADLQNRLFTIFQFIFVAPGVIAQLQPLFIERRDIFETREKKSKMYHWAAFVTGLIVSEIPYLIVCAGIYFACWYFTVGFPILSSKSGGVFFVMLFYEFIYTGIGQAIAAYAPNAVFAALVNPLIISILVSFSGVLVPYSQVLPFWRYWLYYLNPFTYLMGSLLTFTTYDETVTCTDAELAIFDTPGANQTCRAYLDDYLASPLGIGANLTNPDARAGCRVCQFTTGADYLRTLNIESYSRGWRDAAIVVLFAVSSYGCVYALMKLRTKASKKAE